MSLFEYLHYNSISQVQSLIKSITVNQGVPLQDASYFVGRSYLSMVQDAEYDCETNPRRFDDLIEEQTPGGLNEQVRNQNLFGGKYMVVGLFFFHMCSQVPIILAFPVRDTHLNV